MNLEIDELHLQQSSLITVKCIISVHQLVGIYIAPLSKAQYNWMPLIHTHTPHTLTAIGCHAKYQKARQEQLGVRCLAKGHFDTPRVGSNRQSSDCQTTALTSGAISPLMFQGIVLSNHIFHRCHNYWRP